MNSDGFLKKHANLFNNMTVLVEIAAIYTKVIECACYALRGSV